MTTNPAELAVLAIAVLGAVLGAYLVRVGIRQGVLDRRIEIHDSGRYLTGRDALVRGVIYIVLGACFLVGTLAALVGFVARWLGFPLW